MPTAHTWDVFLSYASEDLAGAREVRDALVRAGWRVFLSEDDLHLQVGSAQWSETIDRVLDDTTTLALLVTPHALASRWVSYEWRSVHDAILSGKRGMVIPLIWQGVEPEELPRALRRYQAIDMRQSEGRDEQLSNISELIRGYMLQAQRIGRGQGSLPSNSIGPAILSRRPAPESRRLGAGWLLGMVAAGALAVGIFGWSRRGGVAAPKPAPATAPVVAQALQPPRLGLRVLSIFERPTDATLGEIRTLGAWEEAQRDFQRAAGQLHAPARWRVAAQLAAGQRARLSGADQRAIAALQQVVAQDPSWATAQLALSAALLAKDPAAALRAAQKARSLDPSLWTAVAALGDAHLYAGDVERAIEEYRRALALAPGYSALKGELAIALHYAGGSYDQEAARLAREALQANDQLVSPRLVLAELALERGAGAEALRQAQTAASLAPRDVRCHLALGDALQLLQRLPEARAAWATAVRLSQSASRLGVALSRLQRVKAALDQGRDPPPRGAVEPSPDAKSRLRRPPERSAPRPAPSRSGPREPRGDALREL